MLSKINFSILTLILILFVHSFILTKLQFFPYPELFVYPYLTNNGLKPYKEILDQHFPGLLFLPINFDNLGMNDEQIARFWQIMIVIITHILLFLISKKILKDDKKALLVNVLYLIWHPFFEGWVLWLDNFMPLFSLVAFYSLLKNKLFLTGLFIGVSIVFKQVTIPLAGLIFIYILWEKEKIQTLLNYLIGILMPLSIMLLYLINLGALNDFIYWTIIFNLTTYAQFGTQAPTTLGFITRVGLVYLSSLLFLFHNDKRVIYILTIFLIGSLVSILDRADFVHLQPSLPFAILATSLGIFSINRRYILIFLILIYAAITFWWQNIFYKGHISNKVFFFDNQTKTIAEKVRKYSEKDDKIFVFGAPPHLYQMAERLPPGNIFVFQFPWFLQVAGDRILEGIKKDTPKIVVSDRTVKIEGQKITEFAKKIDKYILDNYEQIDYVGTTAILRKKYL